MTKSYLKDKSSWVRRETLKIHKYATETRIASCLSDIEIFVALYYGGVLTFRSDDLNWEGRDRFIVSKGHGAMSLFPIFADFGFFDKKELLTVCQTGSDFGSIPDTQIPGFETINGSLGHGLGVSSGMSLALKRKKNDAKVFVLLGDGELNSGAVWEAMMFASQNKLDNLTAIVDFNKICMLDFCRNILNIEPLQEKFAAFGWHVETVDGHDPDVLKDVLMRLKETQQEKPKVIIADTVKGKGVPELENDSLCHIKSVDADKIDKYIAEV